MTFQLPRIYPITDRRLSGISHTEQVTRLADAGAAFIQIREKYLSSGEFYAEAAKALEFARTRGIRVIINDRVDIALLLGAAGVHLGQQDLPPDAARKLLGADAIIGYSTHTLEQAMEAVKMPVDYIAFGPIFPTTTKEDPDPTVGLELLRQIREATNNIPLVAIGGITRQNAVSVFEAGADSVAVISDLISDPAAIFSKFAELNDLKSPGT